MLKSRICKFRVLQVCSTELNSSSFFASSSLASAQPQVKKLPQNSKQIVRLMLKQYICNFFARSFLGEIYFFLLFCAPLRLLGPTLAASAKQQEKINFPQK